MVNMLAVVTVIQWLLYVGNVMAAGMRLFPEHWNQYYNQINEYYPVTSRQVNIITSGTFQILMLAILLIPNACIVIVLQESVSLSTRVFMS